jgi:shikimate kinase
MLILRKPVILCGFMACGKTAVGTALAASLKVPFLDTDETIVREAGKSIAEIFKEEGEAGFRSREHRAALSVSSLGPSVISTGGGLMTFERNASVLSECGTVILLERDFHTSFLLLRNDSRRPIACGKTEAELRSLYESRINAYQKYAAAVIKNNGSIKSCVNSILAFLEKNQVPDVPD